MNNRELNFYLRAEINEFNDLKNIVDSDLTNHIYEQLRDTIFDELYNVIFWNEHIIMVGFILTK